MKTIKLLFLLSVILTGLTFSSCDDDDKEDSINYGPSNAFTGNYLKTINGATVKYNSDGLVDEIADENGKMTFVYTNSNPVVVTATAEESSYPEDNYTIRMELGSNGFVTKASQVDSEGETVDWEFKYNSDGQLTYAKKKKSSGNQETSVITYEGGNAIITEFTETDICNNLDCGYFEKSVISYSSKENPKGIENKGCLMIFGGTLRVYLYELNFVYFAGLLGRPTKSLPLSIVGEYGWVGSMWVRNEPYKWTLNGDGYPSKCLYSAKWNEYETFEWITK